MCLEIYLPINLHNSTSKYINSVFLFYTQSPTQYFVHKNYKRIRLMNMSSIRQLMRLRLICYNKDTDSKHTSAYLSELYTWT